MAKFARQSKILPIPPVVTRAIRGPPFWVCANGLTSANVWLAVHTGSRDLAYVEGEGMDHYLNDMVWRNEWSLQNHLAIMNTILVGMRFRLDEDAVLTCIHNYMDDEYVERALEWLG